MAGGTATGRFPNGLLSFDLDVGTEIVRIHWQAKGPVFFGPSPGDPPANRFDAPGSEFRVLYAALQLPGAFVETVLRRPGRVMRRSETDLRAATRLALQRPLVLAKVMDEGLQWHGVHAGEISIDDYAPSRQLALDFHTAFPVLDGLAYRSRYNNGQICFALFDRVEAGSMVPAGQMDFHSHPAVIDDLMALYGAVFDTSGTP